ncbi:uncharacterized protein DEA37_0000086, partial [Paragonimus westermani]
ESVAFEAQLGVVGAALIFAGAVLVFTAILGAVAYYTHSRLLLVVTYSLLLVILLSELGGILLSVLHWSDVGLYVYTTLKSDLDDYGFDEAVIANVDYVQTSVIGLHNSCIPSCNTVLRSSSETTYALL